MFTENLNIFAKLFSLLYADGTIILSETEGHMQCALSIFEKYCQEWKLKVDLHKANVIILCIRKSKINQFLSCVERIYKLKTIIHI